MRALYLSQTGMTEPLAQSQVVPYLRGLARAGWEIDLVALEPHDAASDRVEALVRELHGTGIYYTPGRRSPAHDRRTKLKELTSFFIDAASLAARRRHRIVHARSDLPTTVAVALGAFLPGAKTIYDFRGFLADEYADFGYWDRTSLNYRGLRAVERGLFRAADAIVSLTDSARRHVIHELGWVDARRPFAVIPCCVDTNQFTDDRAQRVRMRETLGLDEFLCVAYAGNLGSWYCEEEMAALFAAIRRQRAARFLVVTRAKTDRLMAALRRERVPPEDVVTRSAAFADVPALLRASDVAISFARPTFSKRASSPVKIAEYLAVGASVVMNRGVGDEDELLDDGRGVFDAGDLSTQALARAATAIVAADFGDGLRADARAVALERFDLERVGIARYVALYAELSR
jgi:glycosyltransferase involved in cell wall biosynthesis